MLKISEIQLLIRLRLVMANSIYTHLRQKVCHTTQLFNLKLVLIEFTKPNLLFREKTGLPLATYFSATKLLWLIKNNAKVKFIFEYQIWYDDFT